MSRDDDDFDPTTSPMHDPIRTYMVPDCTMPFCKGCGHSHVVRKLDEALVDLQLDPSDICLVSDIGCIGLADGLFETPHTVHTTHGRSTAFATGIELADAVLGASRLKTVVLIGDGGAMIGLQHLVNAALLDVDITVLLCNNFLFGMTGGQNSAFSPFGFVTSTTPQGNIVPPMDLCRVAMAARAGFVARRLATDNDLAETIARGIRHPGFALIEVVELCTEYGTSRNEIGGKTLVEMLRAQGQELGILLESTMRREFGVEYAAKYTRDPAAARGSDREPRPGADALAVQYESALRAPVGIVLAGSAGERVQSAAYRFCQGAVRSGLYCTQKSDNPVTQSTGFSLSEIIVSPREILYTGIDSPAIVAAVSPQGLRELWERGTLEAMSEEALLLLDSSLEAPPVRARVRREPFRKQHGNQRAALAALELVNDIAKLFPPEALDASRPGPGDGAAPPSRLP